MKVILLHDIANIGHKFEIKNVSDGFALNYLIPKGLVEAATGGALKKAEAMKMRAEAERKIQDDLLMKNIESVNSTRIEMTERANEQGHLFSGIHKEQIVKALKEQAKLDLLPDHLSLEKPIKEVGEFRIEVGVHDKKASFKLIVKPTL